MPKINPFVAQFLAIVAVLVALFGWLRAEMGGLRAGQIELLERVVRLEAGQGELLERVVRLEAGQGELLERVVRLEAGQEQLRAGQTELVERVARVEAGQASTGERMARIEGTVAGALGRPFPSADRPADAPGAGE